MTTSDCKWLQATANDYEWLQMVTSQTTSDDEWLKVTKSNYKRLRVTTSGLQARLRVNASDYKPLQGTASD